MRDQKRIQRIVDKLGKIWDRNSDLRFFQLISVMQSGYSMENSGYGRVSGSGEADNSSNYDFFNLEDDLFEEWLDSKMKTGL